MRLVILFCGATLWCLKFIAWLLQGTRIQATILPDCVSRFWNCFQENCVYLISNFKVCPNDRSTKITSHDHRLKLLLETIVVNDDNYIIQRFGLSFLSSLQILEHQHGCGHLVGGCCYVFVFVFFVPGGSWSIKSIWVYVYCRCDWFVDISPLRLRCWWQR